MRTLPMGPPREAQPVRAHEEHAAALEPREYARLWRRLAYTYGVIVALGVGYALFRMPFQVSDNVGYMLSMIGVPLRDLVVGNFHTKAYLRPLLWDQLKVVFELANGHYFVTFKAFHTAQVIVLLVLFVRLLEVRTRADFAAAALATTILMGIHTFDGSVREAYPINTFMTILVSCMLGANLSFARPAWWRDIAGFLIFVYALFTVETGILVWVGFVTAYIVGWRGVSAKALVASTLVLLAYFYLRFGPLQVGAPGLTERSSGYGFSMREPEELIRMFGARPLLFYFYNVACSVLTVPFAEPRAGVWKFTAAFLRDDVRPWQVVTVTASTLTTLVLIWFSLARVRSWLRFDFQHDDRLVILFWGVLLANAAISFPYTKDVIMSPAGAFYALAAFAAIRRLVSTVSRARFGRWIAVPVAAVLLLVSITWTVRAIGLFHGMRHAAFVNRNDWASVDEWSKQRERDAKSVQFIERLRVEAVGMPVPNPYFTWRELERYFDPY